MAPLSLSNILLATLTAFCTLNVVGSSDEVDALMKWKSTLHTQNMSILLPSWTYDLNLNFSAKKPVSPCNWFGISFNENSSINRLNLSSSGLKGALDHLSFSSFPNLLYFELSLNNFSGIIPSEICHLSKLVYLDFSSNQFTGIIPPEIGKLTNLVTLHLYENQLNGSIPQSICQMKFLFEIWLNDNNLCGPIPTCFGQLSNLTGLALFTNKLNGSIPREIGKLTSLRLLRLERNNLTGPIPSSLGKLRSLWALSLFSNKLNGSIPSSFGNLQTLEYLSLFDNQLSGSLPPELGKLRLVQLEFTNNSFSGRLPDGIGDGRKLEYFLVGDNKLTCQMPKSLYNCSSLIRIRFDGNQITGDISKSFGFYPHLKYINLNDNMVYGEISDNWSKCRNLTTIQMGGNRIRGNIPPSLGNMIQLELLNFSFNHLVGEIPKEFERLTRMGKLYLNNNRLSGIECQELGYLVELLYLDLFMNKLNGSIPYSLGKCSKLFSLNMSNNEFNGKIPVQLSRLVQLSFLDLSHNSLVKEIPSELSSMISLETLNLSLNKLSGYLPESLESMNGLLNIDLSYNHLQGPLPKSEAFFNLSIEALQANDNLCGNVTGLKQCASQSKHKLALVISLPLLGGLLLGALMGIFSFCRLRSKILPSTQRVNEHKHGKSSFSISTFNGRETYEEIVTRTEEFNEAYCIGTGGCGSVYKVNLSSGDTVAVKRLHLSTEMINDTGFLNEIRALTRIRHRNIVKLLGYCSHSQISFLVYEYLEGGSLADILSHETAQNLDWTKRVNIIKGVAYALSYMHYDCSPAIIHRDISSKNILLDSEYEACVSDFGTSKILNPNSSIWSNIVGTFGYLAPELAYTMKVTEKYDVYSFGVLVLEIIKGEHPGDVITSLASTSMEEIKFADLVDHRLVIPLPEIKEVLTSMLTLAIKCINSNPEIRPAMHQVSKNIAGIICNMYKSDIVV